MIAAVALLSVIGVILAVFLVTYALAYAPLVGSRPRYDPKRVLLTEEEETRILRTRGDAPLNAIAATGVHNGCHRANAIAAFVSEWNYTHVPFVQQLRIGLRHVEIDVWFDRRWNTWRVFHEFVDPLTNGCPGTFRECLEEIRAWSVRTRRRRHLPLNIYIDVKGAYWGAPTNMCAMLCGREGACCAGRCGNFRGGDGGETSPAYLAMENDILAAFEGDYASIFKPSDLYGSNEGAKVGGSKMKAGEKKKTHVDGIAAGVSIREALRRRGGWPTLRALEGKVFFVLNTTFGRRGRYHQRRRGRGGGARQAGCGAPLMWIRSEVREGEEQDDDSVFHETFDPTRAAAYARRGHIVRCLYTNRSINAAHVSHARRMVAAGVQYFACDDLRFASDAYVGVAGAVGEGGGSLVGGLTRTVVVRENEGCRE